MPLKPCAARLCALMICVSLLPFAGAVTAPEVSAKSAILMDAHSGRVLFQTNADQKRLIASTTKIMTAYLALQTANPDDRVTIKREHTLVEGTRVYFSEGDVLTVRELLIGVLLQSGNDAALALAGHCGGDGGVDAFVVRMNAAAWQLGMSNTNFANPHGLNDDNHYSTARDMGVLTAAALADPAFKSICSMKTGRVGNITFKNHNKLLWQYDGAIGVKTGYTKKAGRCLVSGAERGGRVLVAVTLDAPSDWQDHAEMLDLGFEQYPERLMCTQGDLILELPVVSGTPSSVEIRASKTVSLALSDEEYARVVVKTELPRFAWAPVGHGKIMGRARYLLDGECVAVCELYAGRESALNKAKRKWPWG